MGHHPDIPVQHELVALWRMEADINNGGFLQFLGNWGVENHQLTCRLCRP
jgi:hypothetical protein